MNHQERNDITELVKVVRTAKFSVGQKVTIKMEDHRYFGQVGVVEMVLPNNGIPDAVLIRMPDGFQDWFFGETDLLEPIQ